MRLLLFETCCALVVGCLMLRDVRCAMCVVRRRLFAVVWCRALCAFFKKRKKTLFVCLLLFVCVFGLSAVGCWLFLFVGVVGRWLLFVVCCVLLSVCCCLISVVCLVCDVRCLLFVVCCVLFLCCS